jgi:hypothetical protein
MDSVIMKILCAVCWAAPLRWGGLGTAMWRNRNLIHTRWPPTTQNASSWEGSWELLLFLMHLELFLLHPGFWSDSCINLFIRSIYTLRACRTQETFSSSCTASVVWCSEFLATDPEVLGSIHGAPRFSERQRLWNGIHSASWGQLRSYLEEKVAAAV